MSHLRYAVYWPRATSGPSNYFSACCTNPKLPIWNWISNYKLDFPFPNGFPLDFHSYFNYHITKKQDKILQDNTTKYCKNLPQYKILQQDTGTAQKKIPENCGYNKTTQQNPTHNKKTIEVTTARKYNI